jgi:hypothetical protein
LERIYQPPFQSCLGHFSQDDYLPNLPAQVNPANRWSRIWGANRLLNNSQVGTPRCGVQVGAARRPYQKLICAPAYGLRLKVSGKSGGGSRTTQERPALRAVPPLFSHTEEAARRFHFIAEDGAKRMFFSIDAGWGLCRDTQSAKSVHVP